MLQKNLLKCFAMTLGSLQTFSLTLILSVVELDDFLLRNNLLITFQVSRGLPLYRLFQKSWARFDNEYLGNYQGHKNASGKFKKLVISFFTWNVQCEHHWSHNTYQAYSPILAKRVPALHCQWLLLLFVPFAHPRL